MKPKQATVTDWNDDWSTAIATLSGLRPGVQIDGHLADEQAAPIAASSFSLQAGTRPDGAGFSFVAMSCNAPYDTRDTSPRGYIHPTKTNSYELLRLRARGVGHPAPSYLFGLGDQIYVDADADSSEAEKIALFDGTRSAFARYSVGTDVERVSLLGHLYSYHFSVPPLREALSKVPSAFTWDDHDIRDGWGSQGDEWKPGGSPDWPAWYATARSAYVSWQTSKNPGFSAAKTQGSTAALKDALEAGRRAPPQIDQVYTGDLAPGVHYFLPDVRSNRDASSRRKVVLGDKQLEMLRGWLTTSGRGEDQGDVFVLGLPAPLSGGRLRARPPFETEGDDDIRDGWDANRRELQGILTALSDHFRKRPRDRLLIISGDVHESGVFFLTLTDPLDGRVRVFGHEIVSSGIANDRRHVSSHSSTIAHWASDNGRLTERGGVEIFSHAYGSIWRSPSFAELFMGPERIDGKARDRGVTFWPSADDPELPKVRFAIRPVNSAETLERLWRDDSVFDFEPYWPLHAKCTAHLAECSVGVSSIRKHTGPALVELLDTLPPVERMGSTVLNELHDASVIVRLSGCPSGQCHTAWAARAFESRNAGGTTPGYSLRFYRNVPPLGPGGQMSPISNRP